MRGEDVAGGGRLQRLFKRQPMAVHVYTNLFQHQKRGVAFIHVKDRGFQTHRLKRAHAADSQHNFLADARVDVPAIERVSDVAILRQLVFGNIRIQEVEGDASYLDLPDLDVNIAGG